MPSQDDCKPIDDSSLVSAADALLERVRVDELAPGQCATVCEVDVSEASAGQLMAMGVCEGRRVELVKCGDPLILRVLGSRIGLSARLARGVLVEPCTTTACPTDGPTDRN